MPIPLPEFVSRIQPAKTSLLLGAGSSIPSGGPSGTDLAHALWAEVAQSSSESDDLQETATILVRRYGRKPVVDAVVDELKNLSPTGGMLALPRFGWPAIYTTNFDKLIEKAYRREHVDIVPIRSNYDFSYREADAGIRLYKLHGCISQDASFGHKASMTLTESDYELFEDYREALFARLSADLLTRDVLVIGHSLRDRHLSDLAKKILAAKAKGAPGAFYLLVYDKDDLRAPLLEDKGAKIAFGSLDEFTHLLAGEAPEPVSQDVDDEEPSERDFGLPLQLVSIVENVAHSISGDSNIVKMFNGSPATYSDIRDSSTFERTHSQHIYSLLHRGEKLLTVLVGAAGVGKTTSARQLAFRFSKEGAFCWEHKNDFLFKYEPWLEVEEKLRRQGKLGVLLIDECTHSLRAINQLADRLATIESCALRLILTANAAQWERRLKFRSVYTLGEHLEISRLDDSELYSLINLLENNPAIASLVQPEFKAKARASQFSALRLKCSADMFVCLKNIFATESLDAILLTEYEQLDESLQEYYRYVAALQAIGTKVHRQLIIRMLGLQADAVQSALLGLKGIVDEYDIKPKEGIYGWSTRHIVIARKITDYKFSSHEELEQLFRTVIANINPSIPIELQSVRELCDLEYGIGRLSESEVRRSLYGRLIEIAPGERIPWHRLVRELLDAEDPDLVEFAIRDAETAVGADAPIDRYKVRLLLLRSKKTKGISPSDRVALVRRAYEVARRNVEIHKFDKYSYYMLCDVALQLMQSGESAYILDEAIHALKSASEELADPEISRRLQHYESMRFRKNG